MEPNDPRLTLGRFLRDVAARHPERTAVVSEDRSLSYRELEAEARLLARALVGKGVVKGARVALLMANRPEWLVASYAVGMLGAVLVPVNTFAAADELDFILRHGDASLLLAQSELLSHHYLEALEERHPQLREGAAGRLQIPALPQLRAVVGLDVTRARGGIEPWSALLACAEGVDEALLDALIDEVEPSDDALIIYTSGSTAQPKGVVHSQRTPVLQAWRFRDFLDFGPEDRVYTCYPFFWTAGIAMSIGATLAAGGCLLVQQHFEPGAALEMIEAQRATSVHAWPHQQKALGEHESAAVRDLSSVRKVDLSSPLATLAGVEEDVYGVGASYGLSETFTITSAVPATAPWEERRDNNGRPWPGMQIRIVDPESGAVRAPGEAGEIAVKGASLMRGYQKVLPEHVFDADGYFRTQDGGSLDAEGLLHWTGRLSNLIKTGGANVSPVEIQNTVDGHPDIKVGLAVGVGHPTLGEIVVLCAVPMEGADPDEAGVRAWLRKRLAVYKVPRRVLFFAADELDYTANQKIRAEPLREAALKRLAAESAVVEGYRYGA
ncbi:MAG: acyl--CoA ligase [Myxococcales bacterium]|nr:acyl--CoA ligase [Myxococcales bacterium]